MTKNDEDATKTSGPASDAKAGDGKGGPTTAASAGGAQSSAGAAGAGDVGGKGQSSAGQATVATNLGASQTDAVAMLKADHRKVEALFDQFEKAGDGDKAALVELICDELIIHAELEEKIFYPAARQPSTDDQLDEAQVEHDAAKLLIRELMGGDDSDEYRDAKVKVLGEQIKTHIKEEEAPDGVLAKAQKAGINTRELAERLSMLKQRLQQQAQSDRLPDPRPVSFQRLFMAQENRMPRQSNDRDRDEYGRFTSDDDRRGSYSSSGRGGRDYDEDRGGRSGGRGRDEEGRFTSGRGGGARDYDDDRGGRGGGRGQGGWFGDSEGHSEASRRAWEERGGGEGRRYRSEERSYASRGRDDDDERGYGGRGGGRGRDEEGRFTSGRSSGRDYDDDRGGRGAEGRGWFGDAEGHSEAARRGWDEREGGGARGYGRGRDDEDDRGSRDRGGAGGRGRDEEGRFTSGRGGGRGYDDDDRGRSRGGGRAEGHGGWFGDSEGHAQAARRGWEDRR